MRPWNLLHGVGFGDVLNAESFWPPERKASLQKVYHSWWGSDAARSMVEVMRACPDFRHVQHEGLDYPTQRIPGAVATLRDQPIFHRMKFYGSSFLTARLECDVPKDLPERFVYIQPSSPKNGRLCDRWIRDEEWPAIIERLKSWYAVGLVVNLPGGKSTVPDHPLLIDWTGRTSVPQSIEVLKQAAGYVGIDSCFAILAAQIFEPDRLAIRTNNPYVIENPDLHYPPQTDFSFLYPAFNQPPHEPPILPRKAGTIIDIHVNCLVGKRNHSGGDRVEMDPTRAKHFLDTGRGTRVDLDRLEEP